MDANKALAPLLDSLRSASLKKRIAIVSCLVMVLALVVGGTLAYFYDADEATNVFSTADKDSVEIEVEEPDFDPEDGEDVLPGDTISKNPTVTNTGTEEVYVRFVVTLTDSDGTVITDAERAAKILEMIVYAASGLDTSTGYSSSYISSLPRVNPSFTLDTSRGSTGIYYYNYNTTLKADESVVLFNYVVVPTDWTQDDLDLLGDFNIVVRAEAIQAANIASASDAFTALDTEVQNASSSSSSSSSSS